MQLNEDHAKGCDSLNDPQAKRIIQLLLWRYGKSFSLFHGLKKQNKTWTWVKLKIKEGRKAKGTHLASHKLQQSCIDR